MSLATPAMAATIAIEAAIKIIAAYKKAGLVTQEYLDSAIKIAEEKQNAVVDRIRES